MAVALASAERRPLGLALVLEPASFAELLERHLGRHDPSIRVRDVRIYDVQHAGDGATVLARVSLRSDEVRRTGRQQLFVRVASPSQEAMPPPERLLARYQVWRRVAGAIAAPLPVGVLSLAEVGVTVYAFPVDPVLTSLGEVTDPAAMRAALNELWRRRGVKVRQVRVETLAYTPEARAALRYEVLSECRDTGIPEIRHLVGKLQQRKSPAALFAGHWAVWRGTVGRARVAPPVGYLAVPGLSLQEVVGGERLSDLAGRGDFVKWVRQAARSIAAVHALELPLLAVRGADKEVRSVRRWAEVLRRIRPALSRRLERLETRLVAELEARTRRIGPVHSDFHLANILADGEGVTLIDWDQVAVGDPASDVGRFLGALRVSALRTTGRADGLAAAGAAFLDGYLAARSDDVGQIRLFEACGLVVAAASPYRLQREGWEESADAMLAEGEALLERAMRRSVGALGREPREPRDLDPEDPEDPEDPRDLRKPGEPVERHEQTEAVRLEWALDPVFAQALLVPLIRNVHGDDLEIYRCRCWRLSRKGSRLRLRWLLSGRRGAQPWQRFVHGIALSPPPRAGHVRRLEALRQASAERPEALLLPRPLGYLAPLGLSVMETPWLTAGERLELPSADGEAEAALGRGLGAVQSAVVELGRARGDGGSVRAVARRVATLQERRHPLAARFQRLIFAASELLSSSAPSPSAPVLRGFELRELQHAGDRIGVLVVRDVVAGPRPLTVAALLAELATRVDQATGERAAAALRRSWLDASGAESTELRPFEALALVRLAADAALRQPAAEALAARLTAVAERVLSETGGALPRGGLRGGGKRHE